MPKVIKLFYDLQDAGYRYNVGDEYPRKGYTTTDTRIAELASDKNKLGVALIALEQTEEESKPKKQSKKAKKE